MNNKFIKEIANYMIKTGTAKPHPAITYFTLMILQKGSEQVRQLYQQMPRLFLTN